MEFMEIINHYLSIWSPSLAAIFGIVFTIVVTMSKLNGAISTFKDDRTIKELSQSIKELSKENQELVKCNKLLLDEITRIKGYADHKKES